LSIPFALQIPRPIYEEMVAQARVERPNECCGFLAGRIVEEDGRRLGRVERRYPLKNTAEEPTRRYYCNDRSQFDAHRDMRERGLEVLAIYHSHPISDPVPSRTDLEWNYWPGVVCLIVSLKPCAPLVRAWWLGEKDCTEAEWEVVI
jgi:proteasome lid subunit RPN8/RPN11